MQSSFAVPEAHPLACSLLSSPALLCRSPACVQGKPHLSLTSLPWPCPASSQVIADSHCMSHRTGLKAASEESRHLSLRHQALIGGCDYRRRSWYPCM